MKVTSLILCAVQAAPGNDGCYWQSSKSGGHIECLPDYYIRGACESVRARQFITFSSLVDF